MQELLGQLLKTRAQLAMDHDFDRVGLVLIDQSRAKAIRQGERARLLLASQRASSVE